jgi:Fe-S cluster assembly protein SufD
MTPWLQDRRQAAAEANAALPLPTLRDEHWRYTSLRGIDFAAFQPAPAAPATPEAEGTILTVGNEAGRIVQRDGAVVVEQLDPEVAARGVVFTSLERAAAEHADLVERYLGTIVGTGEKFAAENAALWSGGALVYVPKGVEVELPLHLAFELATEGAAQHWRVLVIAEESSRFTLFEEHVEGRPGYANGVVELSVGANARVEYVTVQSRHLDTLNFAYHRAEVARDAELDWAACALGSRTGKTRMESRLTGPGSTAKLTGTYIVDGERHLDLDTTQEHDAPHATSDLAFKGVLADRSRAVWRGVIRVAPGAQRTDAYQENRNLLLSPRAHADSIPGLEIETNDVRCTHGATAGPVDRQLLFYLMSRGLERPVAERLVVEGFFADVLERIGNEPVREALRGALLKRLP